ncbi:hypothetical protein I7I50_04327 [Histoplasma capsulatum G186AR]|uniref:Uncharacterized protein n=1 Tax=Ajellomyces capsulatus TaxID=5037 RepID=A0A8H7YK13_AJECA|nr:hypothetical protein I7I52_05235 [Histoplasma capsulatum]QSS75252.1 hypothetical protein I7I50_04327 [Histoplasma capsulatum G186AR]
MFRAEGNKQSRQLEVSPPPKSHLPSGALHRKHMILQPSIKASPSPKRRQNTADHTKQYSILHIGYCVVASVRHVISPRLSSPNGRYLSRSHTNANPHGRKLDWTPNFPRIAGARIHRWFHRYCWQVTVPVSL